MLNAKESGSIGEGKAVKYLERNGYRILSQNYRFRRFGEIDIIAEKDDVIIFIEVKTRSNLSFGTPNESINRSKINKIRKTANFFLMNEGLFDKPLRFDVIEVFSNDVNHIHNAF